MSHRTSTQRPTWRKRAISLLLAAVITAGLLPAAAPRASAHWADAYLDQLVDWGAIRADQTANPDAPLTRAEFMAIINRAYGYTETGEIPFTDVLPTDWFYDDVSIAYTAGYMAGTSETTASPNDTLTREQAVCILGRNMMLKETPGESLAFSDSRDVSSWARGTVKTAVDNYIVSGYPDNTFHPKAAISKAQMAVLVTQCVGTPVSQSGTYSLGGVFGNVTITSPNVTLRDTTISGDLYISGGVGLGGIKLENVNVLGRIIVSGTGESEAGDASVVMRNVTANEMLVDNMRNKTATIRADGITEIANTIVRTSTYLEDNNTDEKGLLNISLEGEPGTHLTLAGRVKEVVNRNPDSTIQVAKGTVAKLTVDESATNSIVQIDRNTKVKELNLDVGTNVVGEGDIDQLNVNAPGSVVSMLPDKIYIRPGLTANIAGVVMDHLAAEQGSTDPRLLSGYPAAKDIAPTGFRADFSGNKRGTIYWAVSNITDGSIEEEDLISPPTYGSKAVQGGSVSAPTGDTVVNAQVTGLTSGGSYYLSALLVDEQDRRSPVKVISFSTPDNSVPAFGQGYPYMSFIGKENPTAAYITAQVAVMATKTCRMYYAVLPRSATAPTVNELRSASVRNNLGYGIVDLEKNQVWDGDQAIIVSRRLEELKDYTLYMWLTDVDGANSSDVISLQFSTPDVTPPEFLVHPYVNQQVQATSVSMGATLNENGTIYWAVVESGTAYPKPNNQNESDNETVDGVSTAKLDSDFAKLQVANGMNALRSGQVTATANTEARLNLTGLQPEKSYDLYYLARDTAGNYSITVYKILNGVHTLDVSGPVVTQKFSKFSGLDETMDPMNDTDIILEFNENVCSTTVPGRDLLSLYQATLDASSTAEQQREALITFATAIENSFKLYEQITGTRESEVKVRRYEKTGSTGYEPVDNSTDWVIDYTKVRVVSEDGKLKVIFPGGSDSSRKGLQLNSGSTYFFQISNLTDNSEAKNPISPRIVQYDDVSVAAGHNVPKFTVVFARLFMTQVDLVNSQWPKGIADSNASKPTGYDDYKVDFSFRVIPDATSTVADGMAYDLLLWTDTTIQYDLYYRVVKSNAQSAGITNTTWADKDGDTRNYTVGQVVSNATPVPGTDPNGWVKLGDSNEILTNGRELFGRSLQAYFNKNDLGSFPDINTLDDLNGVYYEFAVSIKKMGTGTTSTNPATWSGTVNYYVDAVAGTSGNLFRLSNGLSEASLADFETKGLGGGGGVTIGSTDNRENPKRLHMATPFTDSTQPQYAQHFPTFEAGSTSVDMSLTLNRPGTVYYAIAPADNTGRELTDETTWVPTIETMVSGGTGGQQTILPSKVPTSGDNADRIGKPTLLAPEKGNIFRPQEWAEASKAITGTVDYRGVVTRPETVDGLEPNRTYYVYTVIVGSANEPSAVEIYKFKTNPTPRPQMELNPVNNNTQKGVNMTTTNMNSYISYVVYPKTELDKFYRMINDNKNQGSGSTSNMLKDIVANGRKLPTAYADWTILQALTNKYYYSVAGNGNKVADAYFPADGKGSYTAFDGYSVFDIYASANVKENFRSWFSGSGNVPAEIQFTGTSQPATAQTAVDVPIREDAYTLGGDRAFSGAQYYMLAVARSQDSQVTDSADLTCSFLATPYQISDLDPPILTLASGNFTKGSGSITSGSLTLIFDKPVYVDDKRTVLSTTNFFSKGNEGGLGAPTSVSSTGTNTVVTFALTGKSSFSATVAGGAFYNVGGVPATQTLSIDLVSYQEGNNNAGTPITKWRIVVKWGNLGEWRIEDSLNP